MSTSAQSYSRNMTALLVTVVCVCNLLNLSSQVIAGPDEPRYAAAARTMMRDRDFLVPKFNTQLRLVKPILFYWLIAGLTVIGQAVGINAVTAMRLVPIFMSGHVLLATFLLARRVKDKEIALLASGMLLTTLAFHRFARELIVDMTLTAFLMWAWLLFHVALIRIEKGVRTILPLIGLYAALGFASLTKGPAMTALYTVVPMLAYLIWTRRIVYLSRCGLIWGIPLALGIGLSWYAVLFIRGQDSFSVFWHQHLDHLLGQNDHQHSLPLLFYLETIGENFAPWSILMPFAMIYTLRAWRDKAIRLSDSGQLTVCATLIPLLILGVAISKRSLYLLPIYPFLSIWIVTTIRDGLLSRYSGSTRMKIEFAAVLSAALMCVAFEALVAPIRERDKDRVHFYTEIKDRIAARPFGVFGESANEAVWYLDLDRKIERPKRAQLTKMFFEIPDAVLLVSVSNFQSTPQLQQGTAIESRLMRGRRAYLLIIHDPKLAATKH